MCYGIAGRVARAGVVAAALTLLALPAAPPSSAQGKELSDRAKQNDRNGNGVIDRDEAGGPLKDNFDAMDCDRSGTLDGAEIRSFFTGEGCPAAPAASASPAAPSPAAPAAAQTAKKSLPPLSDRAKQSDRNGNGVIDRDEAGGPLKDNFDAMDCDKSGTLDGGEIRGFFTGEGCPAAPAAATKPAAPAAAAKPSAPAAAAKPAAAPGNAAARPVRAEQVISEPLSQTYPVIGRLVAIRAGDVAARINGAVEEFKVAVGTRVKKDQVIAELADDRLAADRDKYAAALKTRQAMLKNAQAELQKKSQELKRMASLKDSSAFSRAKFEDLERDLEVRKASIVERESAIREAEAELKRADIDLYNAKIRAPYDGAISETHTEVGAYVAVGQRVVSMISDRDIEIEAEVPTDRVAGLAPGTTVRFRLDDGTEHLAEVRSVVPQENVRTRTRPVRFAPRFGDTSKPLAANQSVTVNVPVGKGREVVTVHKDAIVYRGQETVVYFVRNNRAFSRKVTLGEAVGNRFIVVSGLQPGETVVTHGNETLPPGTEVRILEGATETRK
jgi:RND family efflux transporter MFP subunit